MQQNRQTNAKAIASLVLSCASMVCCMQWSISLVMAVLGIVFGILGLRDDNPNQEDAAIAGIVVGVAGVILAIGRIVGETAALLYPAGTAPQVADGLFSSGRTLAVHMYALLNEGLYTEQAYATAVVLLVLVVCINALSSFAAKKAGVKEK